MNYQCQPSIVFQRVEDLNYRVNEANLYQQAALFSYQSIPLMDKPWDYAFFIDAEFAAEQAYQEAVEQMKAGYGDLKIFGEYRSRKG